MKHTSGELTGKFNGALDSDDIVGLDAHKMVHDKREWLVRFFSDAVEKIMLKIALHSWNGKPDDDKI